MIERRDVEAAAARIAGHVHDTPILTSRTIDHLVGCGVLFKAEHLQRTGSFKARGAFNWLLQRPVDICAVSSGNHAQAVALAANELGVRAVIVMPEDANPAKLAATRGYGADVVTDGVTPANREEFVRTIAAERGVPILHPYDDDDVMAGQGTCALDLPEVDAVYVPVGGGGLIAGVATAYAGRVIGVEPNAADDCARSLRAGERVALDDVPDTICDGVRALTVGERPWDVISRRVHDIVTVSDAAVRAAVDLLRTRSKQAVEPSGALGLAALLEHKPAGQRVAIVLSGGNNG